MPDVPVDIDQLTFAWEDDSPDNNYYLDTDTGEIHMVNRNLLDLRDLTDEIEVERDRFIFVPRPDREKLKSDLRDFANTIEDAGKRSILDMAFESPHVLSGFKKILASGEGEVERLEEFLRSRQRIRIKQWLEANCIVVTERKEEMPEPELASEEEDA